MIKSFVFIAPFGVIVSHLKVFIKEVWVNQQHGSILNFYQAVLETAILLHSEKKVFNAAISQYVLLYDRLIFFHRFVLPFHQSKEVNVLGYLELRASAEIVCPQGLNEASSSLVYYIVLRFQGFKILLYCTISSVCLQDMSQTTFLLKRMLVSKIPFQMSFCPSLRP